MAYFRIPSFIVTLAGMLVFKGLTLWLLAGQSVGPFPPEFQQLGSGFIPDFFGGDGSTCSRSSLGCGVAALILWLRSAPARQAQKYGLVEEPFAVLRCQERASSPSPSSI